MSSTAGLIGGAWPVGCRPSRRTAPQTAGDGEMARIERQPAGQCAIRIESQLRPRPGCTRSFLLVDQRTAGGLEFVELAVGRLALRGHAGIANERHGIPSGRLKTTLCTNDQASGNDRLAACTIGLNRERRHRHGPWLPSPERSASLSHMLEVAPSPWALTASPGNSRHRSGN
jgi:hypothetical protein